MANHRNVDDARFIKIQHLPATTITWKEKDNTQYARAKQKMATPWKLDDARFIKNQQSRSRLRSRSRSQLDAPNCECTENLTCMTQQSSKKQTTSHFASPKGSVDGTHCEEPAHSFSADWKRQAVPAGVDLSPSLSRSMSLLATSQVSLSLSLSVLLSVSLSCSLSLSFSLSPPHTSRLPFFPSLCVFLGLCASSLSLYPDAGKL